MKMRNQKIMHDNFNTFWIGLLFFMGLLGCGQGEISQEESGSLPNIVFIFADDLSYEAIGAVGIEKVHTPNLDRLMAQGVSFTHAYNMGGWNGAICVASRAMIISGQYLWHAQAKAEQWRKKDSTAMQQTWGQWMQQAGYDTYFSGKWHVDAPASEVFQVVDHVRPGMPRDRWILGGGKKVVEAIRNGEDPSAVMPVGYNRPLSPQDDSWDPTDTSFGGFWEGGMHWSEVIASDAMRYLDTAISKKHPYFMYLAFNAPHDPRQAPQFYLDQYPVDEIAVPDNFLPNYPFQSGIGLGPGLRDEALAPFPRTTYAVQKHRQEYFAIISHMDAQIGRIMDRLEAEGQLDNTYIFFTADHGLSVGHHGLLGKQNMYDHSMRVPLILAGPNLPRGAQRNQPVYLQDIMATAMEIAGSPAIESVAFHSLLELIQNDSAESPYSEIYGAYIDLQRMLIKDHYKLIVYPKISEILLFDLDKDRQEKLNLANLPEHKERVVEMYQTLQSMQATMDDPYPLPDLP